MDEIKFIPLNKITSDKGSVFHILKNPTFKVNEVYVSTVKKSNIKGWKKHKEMTLNLVVIKGNVKFTFIKKGHKKRYQFEIGDNNYGRLVVKPGFWFCFEGMNDENIIINCADLEHRSDEVDNIPFKSYKDEIPF